MHWKDDSRTRFESELDQVLKRVRVFLAEAQGFMPTLDKKARAIDECRGR